MTHMGGDMVALNFGERFDTEVLLEIEILHQSGKAVKNGMMKNWE